MINHCLVIGGYAVALISTLLSMENYISPVIWMTSIGTGLYLSYVPFNALYFERMIATYKVRSNIGFYYVYSRRIWFYLGSVTLLFTKEFVGITIIVDQFFIHAVILFPSPESPGNTNCGGLFQEKIFINPVTKYSTSFMSNKQAIVIGAGIVGLAMAKSLSEKVIP